MDLQFDLNALFNSAFSYASADLAPKAMQGDVRTIALIAIALIICFVLLILVVELLAWFAGLTKRFLLFFIVGASTVLFAASLCNRAIAGIGDPMVIAIGAAGAIFGAISLAIAALSIKNEFERTKAEKIADLKRAMLTAAASQFEQHLENEGEAEPQAAAPFAGQRTGQPAAGQKAANKTIALLLDERGVLALLSYMVIVELGVLSSLLTALPNELAGIALLILLLAGALIFIKSNYIDYLGGLKRLLIALAIGAILSAAFAAVWAAIPLSEILSLNYFKTSALIAFALAIAAALILGTRD